MGRPGRACDPISRIMAPWNGNQTLPSAVLVPQQSAAERGVPGDSDPDQTANLPKTESCGCLRRPAL